MAARFILDRCIFYSGTGVYVVVGQEDHLYGHYLLPRLEFYERNAPPCSVSIPTPGLLCYAIYFHLTSINIYKVVDVAGVRHLWESRKTTAPKGSLCESSIAWPPVL